MVLLIRAGRSRVDCNLMVGKEARIATNTGGTDLVLKYKKEETMPVKIGARNQEIICEHIYRTNSEEGKETFADDKTVRRNSYTNYAQLIPLCITLTENSRPQMQLTMGVKPLR